MNEAAPNREVVLVPREPTEAMHYDGDRVLANAKFNGGSITDTTKKIWAAMLAAAPAALQPSPDAPSDWIDWKGGENPVPGEMVEVLLASGASYHQVALSDDYGRWWHSSGGQDHITAYRVVSPAAPDGVREKVRQIVDDALNSAISEPWEVADHAADRLMALIAALPPVSGGGVEPVDALGYPTTVQGMLLVAQEVLRDIPRPQVNDGSVVTYSVSDDVPEDIAIARSYVDAALALYARQQAAPGRERGE